MRKLTVKIWLTIAAFFLSATVSVADCSSNANQCTPKQLCSAATSTEGGVKVWSKSSRYSKHVSKAKQVGINCGVVEIVASCDNDPELCSVDDLCKQSVQKSGGKTGWKTSNKAAGHIALAKEFGLKCGVTSRSVTANSSPSNDWKKAVIRNPYIHIRSDDICNRATDYIGKAYDAPKGWSKNLADAETRGVIKEAMRRGLTCGVSGLPEIAISDSLVCENSTNTFTGKINWNKGDSIWVTEAKQRSLSCSVGSSTSKTSNTHRSKKYCSQYVEVCNSTQLCRSATYISGGKKDWNENYFKKHVMEAKRRGMSCGVGNSGTTTASNTSSYTNTTILKNAFRGESVLKRKQIQYALKKLNYYTSSIDALYGPGTERALTGYANAKGLNGRSPNSIFSSVLSQVSVPSSFAVAKRSNNSSSSSSSSSSGGSSAGRTVLQGLFVAGACSLTSNPGACLDGATGNNRSSNTRSSPPKTLSSGTWIKSGNTYIGPGGEAVFDNGRVIQGTDGSLCHRTRNAIICQ